MHTILLTHAVFLTQPFTHAMRALQHAFCHTPEHTPRHHTHRNMRLHVPACPLPSPSRTATSHTLSLLHTAVLLTHAIFLAPMVPLTHGVLGSTHFGTLANTPFTHGVSFTHTFLDASTHLYKRLRPSVRRSVGPLVRNALLKYH